MTHEEYEQHCRFAARFGNRGILAYVFDRLKPQEEVTVPCTVNPARIKTAAHQLGARTGKRFMTTIQRSLIDGSLEALVVKRTDAGLMEIDIETGKPTGYTE